MRCTSSAAPPPVRPVGLGVADDLGQLAGDLAHELVLHRLLGDSVRAERAVERQRMVAQAGFLAAHTLRLFRFAVFTRLGDPWAALIARGRGAHPFARARLERGHARLNLPR